MDYSAMLDDGVSGLKILIPNCERINRAIQAMYQFQFITGYTDEYIEKYSNTNNNKYKSTSKVFNFEELTDIVYIKIEQL